MVADVGHASDERQLMWMWQCDMWVLFYNAVYCSAVLHWLLNFIVLASWSLLSPADTEGRDNMNADLFSETSSMTGESIPASQYTVDSNRSTVFSKVSG